MATRTPAPKRPARKAAQPALKAAAKRRPPRQGAAKPAAATEAASLGELMAGLSKLELAGFAGKLVQGWRKDLESIMQASQKSYAGLQTIVTRQTAQIKDAAGELQSVAKLMTVIGVKDSARNLDDLALASLDMALADIRELAAVAANSQREAFDIVHRRVNENIDEVQRLLHK